MNVLYLIIDDLRNEGATYGQQSAMPNLDALAAGGVTFDRAYCQSSLCSPSRSSFMTGRPPEAAQIWDTFWASIRTHGRLGTGTPTVAANWTTLPGHFKAHGWRVYGAGKTIDYLNQDWPRSWSRERRHFPYSYQRCPGAIRGSQGWYGLPTAHTQCTLLPLHCVLSTHSRHCRTCAAGVPSPTPTWLRASTLTP
jgi:iduronate 2-sulfatase